MASSFLSRDRGATGAQHGRRNRSDIMHVDDAIISRKSIRRFLPAPVPQDTAEHAFTTTREPARRVTAFAGFDDPRGAAR
jgi:hypothetical protein